MFVVCYQVLLSLQSASILRFGPSPLTERKYDFRFGTPLAKKDSELSRQRNVVVSVFKFLLGSYWIRNCRWSVSKN